MSRFVEECRREWKRLRVPDPIADEMADDLAADLEEAEDGASPADVLGSGAADPRAFAASWASERGLVQPRRRGWVRPNPSLPVAVGVLLLLAVAAAFLTARSSHGDATVPRAAGPAVGQSTLVANLGSASAGQIVGTAIVAANVPPHNRALSTTGPTILAHRPATISISFANGGQAAIAGVVRVIVHVDRVAYVRTFRGIAVGSARRVRLALPASFPHAFTVTARTVPVSGERNRGNNQRTWHVQIRG